MDRTISPAFWSLTETAGYLGVPPSTLYQWAYRGVGPRSYKVGRFRKYRPEDVDHWLEDHADEPRDQVGDGGP